MIKLIRSLLLLFAVSLAAAIPGRAVPVTFVYPDGAGEGFNDPTFGAARKACFEAAANNYAAQFNGTVPLVISATFDPKGGTSTGAVLGSAGPDQIIANWGAPGTPPPQADTFYAIGLANQLAGIDLAPGDVDINASFNSEVDGNVVLGTTDFYYGTDGNTGGDIDFYSVVLHEIGHGLGFLSIMSPNGTFGNTFPSSYDRFMQQNGTSLMTMTAAQRQAAAISNNLRFAGPQATAGNSGTAPKLYAPNPYVSGSSVSHLDESTFHGINELMTPVSSEVAHQLGPVATGVFKDIGWGIADPADPEQTGSTLIVNTTDDHNDSSCSEDDCTLREAINSANGIAGTQTINFDVGSGNQQITLASALPVVTETLTIQGPVAQRITVSGNNASRIFITTASLALQNLTVEDGNISGSQGGGLFAVLSAGSPTVSVTNCTFNSNNARQGGGIYLSVEDGSGTLNLTNSTFSGNSASVDGAGILAISNTPTGTLSVTMSGCTVNSNTSSDWGGGLFLWENDGSATATVTNSTFSGNSASSFGGGIIVYNGASLSVDSVTIAGNSAVDGGGVGISNNNPSFTSRNSLYASNGSGIFNGGAITSQGNNLFSDNPDGFTAAGDQKNLSTLAGTLGALASNGGPTQTRALLAGSPAINAGATPLTVDQRGQSRPQGAADDVGAFELVPTNTAPTISAISDKSVQQGVSTGPLELIIGDAETAAGSLTLSKASSNTTLVPLANIVFGGTGSNRTVTVTPAAGQTGTATITLTVSDGSLSANETFVLTVTAPPSDSTPPTVTVTSPADGNVFK